MKIQPYLSFRGNCQQAFNFYKNIFDGQFQHKETWENKATDIPDNYRDKIQHIELTGKGFHFMGYDVSPDTPLNSGNTVCMSIAFTDRGEADTVFEALSNGGQIHTPMQESSWGEYFGRCTDQFDITWMIDAK